jgi:hypothetical protein
MEIRLALYELVLHVRYMCIYNNGMQNHYVFMSPLFGFFKDVLIFGVF